YDRSVDVHVSRLRKKLASGDGRTERIKSIRGAGYIFVSSFALADIALTPSDILGHKE
ncbi:MAG: winged helix-turn-helix domain-containing protein, partial [Smithella sp.]